MNFASYVILAVIAGLFILAVRYHRKHGSSCAECGGGCSECDKCHVDRSKIPERFKLKDTKQGI